MIKEAGRKTKELNQIMKKPMLRDFIPEGSRVNDSSTDFIMLFNILHLDVKEWLIADTRAFGLLEGANKSSTKQCMGFLPMWFCGFSCSDLC
jgi:hypothetical protein